jgi:hypothetical protein
MAARARRNHPRPRDRFRDTAALVAMKEIMRGCPVRENEPEYPLVVAQTAWRVANAMVVARKRGSRGLER